MFSQHRDSSCPIPLYLLVPLSRLSSWNGYTYLAFGYISNVTFLWHLHTSVLQCSPLHNKILPQLPHYTQGLGLCPLHLLSCASPITWPKLALRVLSWSTGWHLGEDLLMEIALDLTWETRPMLWLQDHLLGLSSLSVLRKGGGSFSQTSSPHPPFQRC